MKRYIIVLLFWSVFASGARLCQAEIIRSFESVVKLQKDATLDVTETIVYDFEGAERHGIYRFIPVKYRRYNNTYSIYLDILSITDQDGNALQYKSSREGANLSIRIGDPDVLISGVHTYRIRYTVLRAVNFFKDAPEVYWNATGDQWPVGIQTATARFYPPAGVSLDQLKTASFFGPPGATNPATTHLSNDHVLFQVSNLPSAQGLTFVVGLPAGSVTQPAVGQVFWWFFRDWWPAFTIPLLALLGLTSLYLQSGRDIDGGQAVAVEWYPPKDLSPAEVGTLIDERCDMSDIISTVFDLAARGYMRIHESEKKGFLFMSSKEYTFVRNPDPPGDTLAKHERQFLNGIFKYADDSVETTIPALLAEIVQQRKARQDAPGGLKIDVTDPVGLLTAGTVSTKRPQASSQKEEPVSAEEAKTLPMVSLSDLKDKFYVHVPLIENSIYEELTLKKLFTQNPETTRSKYRGAGVVIAAIGAFLLIYSTPWAIAFIATGILSLLFSKAMPAKTAKGSRKLRECEGFARFVRLVEKPRLEMMQNEDPQVFGRLLPYAIVLGVADQWAEGFEGLLKEPPNWYYPYGYGYTAGYIFSPRAFMNDMGNGMNTMSSTFRSSPSSAGSGGSGFSGGGSGGGFGGGGGGSW